jgi:hypothetical protein
MSENALWKLGFEEGENYICTTPEEKGLGT